MSEPRLEEIGDYNELKGSKKRVVWSVIIVGLIIGTLYVGLSDKYSKVNDGLEINDPIQSMKLK